MSKIIKLNNYDLLGLQRIIEVMKEAPNKAEAMSKQVYGESNSSYEFGYLKGVVDICVEELKNNLEYFKTK